MGWEIFSIRWGVGFSKWPKRVSDFSVKNQGEHLAFFHGAVKEKLGYRRGIFSFKKICLVGLDNFKGFLKVAGMSKKQGYSEDF